MASEWGQFRTTEGEVVVTDGAIRIDRTPTGYLSAQLARWRRGSLQTRVRALARVLGLAMFAAYVLYRVHRMLSVNPGVLATLPLGFLAFTLVPFWITHGRATTIRWGEISAVTLDLEDRDLTITHEVSSRLAVAYGAVGQSSKGGAYLGTLFDPGEVRTTLRLTAAEEGRAARDTIRATPLESQFEVRRHGADDPEGRTVYRVETVDGVVFCERCESQVSPADETCPNCDYRLRVQRPHDGDGGPQRRGRV